MKRIIEFAPLRAIWQTTKKTDCLPWSDIPLGKVGFWYVTPTANTYCGRGDDGKRIAFQLATGRG